MKNTMKTRKKLLLANKPPNTAIIESNNVIMNMITAYVRDHDNLEINVRNLTTGKGFYSRGI